MARSPAASPIVELRNIVKRFPGVTANDNVDLTLFRGETLGLLGENGAGKSVLMSVLYGHYQPDAGEVLIDGTPVVFDSPFDAIAHGIGMVHQHFMLVPPLSVLDNIILGSEPMTSFARIDRSQARQAVSEIAERYRLSVDLDRRVEDIPVGMAQRVEILKAVYRGARVLVLDEPTAVLTPAEVEGLHEIIGALRSEGVPCIFITHKLREVLTFCDRVVVMRRGRVVEEMPIGEATELSLAQAMVGRPVLLEVGKNPATPTSTVLELRDVHSSAGIGDHELCGVDLSVRRGEIVGVAGVGGNGQTNLVAAVAGLSPVSHGEINLDGVDVTTKTRRRRLKAGMSVIPEDRLLEGVIESFPVFENAILGDHDEPRYGSLMFRDVAAMRERARGLIEEYDVRSPDEVVAAGALSGGNQQKLVCGRELDRKPALLLAAQPTRGVDVGAIEFIHRETVRLRDAGSGVLLVSTELDEILSLADRIVVMHAGRIVADLDAATTTAAEVGVYMAGGRHDEEPMSGTVSGG